MEDSYESIEGQSPMRKPRRSRDSMEVRSACVTKETPMFCNDPKMKSRADQIDCFERAISGDSMCMPSVMEEEEIVQRQTGHCNACSQQKPPYSPEPVQTYRILFERSISEEAIHTRHTGRAHVSAEPEMEEDWLNGRGINQLDEFDHIEEFRRAVTAPATCMDPQTSRWLATTFPPRSPGMAHVSETKSVAGWKAVSGPLSAPCGTPKLKPGALMTGTTKAPSPGVFSVPEAFRLGAARALTRSQTEPVADKARGSSKRRGSSKGKGSSGATDLGPAAFGDPLCGSVTAL